MTKERLDKTLVAKQLAASRSQAENLIRLGKVTVDGAVITKAGHMVHDTMQVVLTATEQYVSRAGLKLASVASSFGVTFVDQVVLDIGSSTGGFTDYALQHGARKVYAIDVGTEQLHPSLRGNDRIELHEKTDIRDVSATAKDGVAQVLLPEVPTIIVIDVSFISLRDILPHVAMHLADDTTTILAMVKPQFEAGRHQVNKGVIKNDTVRRTILKDFEQWSKQYFLVIDKKDSEVAGSKGNRERFYVLKLRP